jgi:Flp pilus assembly protein TadB
MKSLTILILAVMITLAASAASNETTTSTKTSSSSSSSSSEETESKEQKVAREEMWKQLTPKQQDCLKEKWQKEGEAIKAAGKMCHDKKGGIQCMKAIPQIQPCFA